jgi:hypothetical protein
MKWLILSESLELNRTSSGICNSNIICSLLALGNDISVMYTHVEGSEPIWLNGAKLLPIQKDDSNYLPLYIRVPKIRALHTVITGFNYSKKKIITQWKNEISKALSKDSYDVILILGSGLSYVPFFALHELSPKIKWIANIHDPYPLFELPPPYNKKRRFYMTREGNIFKQMCSDADGLTFPSQELMEWMSQFNPKIKEKGMVIPHPGKIADNIADVNSNLDVNLPLSKFNMVHAGSLLGPRDPKPLLTAYKQFLEKNPEAVQNSTISVIGKVFDTHGKIEEVMGRFGSNLNIIQRITYKRVFEILKQSDVNIIIEAKTEISPFLPGKFSDYISANKPIMSLSPRKSEVRRLLGYDNVLCTENGNIEIIERIITELYAQWKTRHIPLNYGEDLKEYIAPLSVGKSFEAIARTLTA